MLTVIHSSTVPMWFPEWDRAAPTVQVAQSDRHSAGGRSRDGPASARPTSNERWAAAGRATRPPSGWGKVSINSALTAPHGRLVPPVRKGSMEIGPRTPTEGCPICYPCRFRTRQTCSDGKRLAHSAATVP